MPSNRMIALGECEEVCRQLRADGHRYLAERIHLTVVAHERSCLERRKKAPTAARFQPATVLESAALGRVLAVVRQEWNPAMGAAGPWREAPSPSVVWDPRTAGVQTGTLVPTR